MNEIYNTITILVFHTNSGKSFLQYTNKLLNYQTPMLLNLDKKYLLKLDPIALCQNINKLISPENEIFFDAKQ